MDPARCYACQKPLQPECDQISAAEATKWEQWDNALVIMFEGGHGMFIDPVGQEVRSDPQGGLLQDGDGQLKVVICHDCAHQACNELPWLDNLIQPLRSHAHKITQDWTGHRGWDLPHKCPGCGETTVWSAEEHRKVCPGSCQSLLGIA